MSGHFEIVKYLAEHGADVNAKDNHNTTVLIFASMNDRIEIMKYLAENGANVNAKDKNNNTALMKASFCGHVKIVIYLHENGADVNAINNYNDTALIFASEKGHLEAVKFLIEHGADVNASNKNKDTALKWASLNGYIEIVLNGYIEKEEGDVMIADNKLKKVNDFRYLGSMMESTESDFKRRKGLSYGAWNIMEKIWTAKHVRIELKINIFEASVLSILLYGCESWIITPQLEKKINSFATECYRRMLNIKRTDHITLECIYEQVKRQPLMETVRSRQLGWLGHVMRMESKEEPAKIFALYEPKPSHGKAKRGAKKVSYRSQISKMLTGSAEKLTTAELIELAKDRSEWRKLKNGQDKPPKP